MWHNTHFTTVLLSCTELNFPRNTAPEVLGNEVWRKGRRVNTELSFSKNSFFLSAVISTASVPVAARSEQLLSWDCGFESRRGLGSLSLLSVVCCQVDVSGDGLITCQEESYRLCCVKWVWSRNLINEETNGPLEAVVPNKKVFAAFITLPLVRS